MEIQAERKRSKMILVVDDDAARVKLVTKALTKRGYQVLEAGDGVLAIRIARHEEPDLILLDLGLPLRDGYEVMERLKVADSTAKIPVLVVSARPAETEEAESKPVGAIAYVEKPINIGTFCSLIAQTLHETDATP